jgi:microcystin-dependent protein
MATTSNTYTGNGSNKLFSITFPYLDTTDIDVYLNGTLQTVTTEYTFANATTVEFVTAPANGATVLLDRSTDDTTLQATFFPGSSIKATDLNENFDQVLYLAQETANSAANQSTAGLQTQITAATNTANTAITTANAANSTANGIAGTANTALTNANAAVVTANAAVVTANAASVTATNAETTANAISSTANTALTTANAISSTANTALTNANAAIVAANAAVPAGSVFYFAANAAPTNFLKANGAAISRATYSALFTAVGTTFGVGDGSTTFNVPDLRGEFIRGWDDSRGIDSGRAFGSGQADGFKSHAHTVAMALSRTQAAGNVTPGSVIGSNGSITSSSVGGTETRPRNVALLACIKF